MAIDYNSLRRFGGYSIDQKRHLARLLAVAEGATTTGEISRKVVHKKLAGKFARDETDRYQRLFEGIRASIEGEDPTYNIEPHMHGWRNYQLERLIKSFATTIISEKTYAPPNLYTPSQDIRNWTDAGIQQASIFLATAGAGLGGGTNVTLLDNSAGAGSDSYKNARKDLDPTTGTSFLVRIFVKKKTSAHPDFLIYALTDGTGYSQSYCQFDPQTGVINVGSSFVSDGAYDVSEAAYDSDYWEVICECSPTGGLTGDEYLSALIYPAADATTSIGSAEVGNAEGYMDLAIVDIKGTDPVFNT